MPSSRSMWEAATCARCGYLGLAYVPKGGDGSVTLMRKHKRVGGPGYCIKEEST